MFIDKKLYYEIEEFSKMEVKAIYTTKSLGDLRKDEDRHKILCLLNIDNKKVYSGFQTHSSNVIIIDESTPEFLENTDGFITQREDVVIFTKYADCLPIYFYDKNNKTFGCVHSGWSGSFKRIGLRAIELMVENFQCRKEDIIVAFGIGISIENYEVSEEFYLDFKRDFNNQILENVFLKKEKKYFFDNQQFNYNLMLSVGIRKENIIKNDLCTYSGDFHSYRRDKENSGRNGAYIFIDKNKKK